MKYEVGSKKYEVRSKKRKATGCLSNFTLPTSYFLLLTSSFILLTSSFCLSWWEAGHMLVAEIAYQRLAPEAKKHVDELVQATTVIYPENDSFQRSAVWPDVVRKKGWLISDSWHYTNIPFDPEGILSPQDKALIAARNTRNDALWVIRESIDTLKNAQANAFERGIMLRFLVHVVADIHQPLHTTTRYSRQYPEGDRGGHGFLLKDVGPATLHLFWDDGLGAFPIVSNPPTQQDEETVRQFAREITEKYPPHLFPNLQCLNVERWARESHELAKNVVYKNIQEGEQPSPEYIQRGQDVALRRIAQAGYRLAHLLNALSSDKLSHRR